MRPGAKASDTSLGRRAIAGLAVAAVAAGAYYWLKHRGAEPPAPVADQALPSPHDIAPAIEHPVAAAPAASLPALDDSDALLGEQLSDLIGAERFAALFMSEGIVRRLVATVDNLPRAKVAGRHRPVKPLGGEFAADGEEDRSILSPANYARYEPFVQLLDALDPDRVAAAYLRLYPLFQQAYEDLGYPGGYFNDRLVAAIDNLLAAPEPAGPVELVRPNVLYEFADPLLEARSAGQKLMLRIGPQNAARVKARLRELRRRIANQAP